MCIKDLTEIIQAEGCPHEGSCHYPSKNELHPTSRKNITQSIGQNSSRLPNRTKYIDEIIIATTTNECDASILALCRELNVSYYCGSEWDVLTRYYEAATMYQADVIVRLTSDCPVIDPEIVDRVITHFLHRPDKVDYVSNILKRSYPRGMDTEVFSIQALRTAYQEADIVGRWIQLRTFN
jgi:spore coat polysaccharide biosynthesis protein SpsF (cytidylyltransferase family)